MVAPKLQLTPASVSAACAYAQSALELASSTDMDYTSGKIPSPLPADAEQVNKLWSALYGAVGQLNVLINQDWDEEYMPVLRFYRGLCFFELYYFWQNIPLWLSDRENLAEIPQALPQEALDMVMDDLFYVKHAASRCNPQVFEGDMDMYINAICGVILSIHRQRLADARVEFDTIIGSGYYGEGCAFVLVHGVCSTWEHHANYNNDSGTSDTREVSFEYKFKQGWHHVAVSFNKRALKVYFDGNRVINLPKVKQPTWMSFQVPFDYSNLTFIRNVVIAKGAVALYDRNEQSMTAVEKAIAETGKFVTNNILFETGKATLKPESMEEIEKVAAYMLKNPGARFEVQGHTDNQGSDKINDPLSQQRAEAVVKASPRCSVQSVPSGLWVRSALCVHRPAK